MNEVLDQLRRSTATVLDALERTDLLEPSDLPDWSRLTIACHLRYGATAFHRMTVDALAGRPSSYYPGGRATQRPGTLVPEAGESGADVVASLRRESDALAATWDGVEDWSLLVTEPSDNPDLGPLPMWRLPLSRLTEVEVHGTDLGVGLGPWSDVLVRTALPMRLEWLNTRRSNHRDVDTTVRRSWLLVATDGPTRQRIEVDGEAVTSAPGDDADEVIEGTSSELFALLLGRAPDGFAPPDFSRALPGP